MTTNAIVVSPIGSIRAQDGQFVVQIDPAFRPALNGLEGFSYVQVLWWSHFLDQPEMRQVMECEQPYVKGPAKLGIFATRSPLRPNPICLSAAPVIRVDVEAGVIYPGLHRRGRRHPGAGYQAVLSMLGPGARGERAGLVRALARVV